MQYRQETHHDAISGLKNLKIVLESLLILNFGNNLDSISTIIGQNFANELHIRSLTHKRRGNEINPILNPPIHDVIHILLRQSRKIHDNPRKIHILPLANGAIVLDAGDDFSGRLVAGKYGEDERSVGDEDGLAGIDAAGQGGVGAGDFFVVALVGVVVGEGEGFAFGESDGFGAVGEEAGADFGAFGV